jgi:hypothetical protein
MSKEDSYRQLAVFSTIVAEVVISPGLLGGATYWLLRGSFLQPILTPIAAVLGLVIAFYRISLLRKQMDKV